MGRTAELVPMSIGVSVVSANMWQLLRGKNRKRRQQKKGKTEYLLHRHCPGTQTPLVRQKSKRLLNLNIGFWRPGGSLKFYRFGEYKLLYFRYLKHSSLSVKNSSSSSPKTIKQSSNHCLDK